jgi:hypothetical protein
LAGSTRPAVHLRAPASQIFDLIEGDGIDPAQLISGVRATFAAISDISAGGGLPAGFAAEFPRQLVDSLLCDYLIHQQPRWGYLLLALGIIRFVPVPAVAPRLAFVRKVVAYEEFGELISDPFTFFRNSYKWGESGFRGLDFQLAIAGLAQAWGGRVRQTMLDPDTAAQLTAGAIALTQALDTVVQLILVQSGRALRSRQHLFMLPGGCGCRASRYCPMEPPAFRGSTSATC